MARLNAAERYRARRARKLTDARRRQIVEQAARISDERWRLYVSPRLAEWERTVEERNGRGVV